jgi:hypothetical protein
MERRALNLEGSCLDIGQLGEVRACSNARASGLGVSGSPKVEEMLINELNELNELGVFSYG